MLTLLSFIPGAGPFLAFAKANTWVWKMLGGLAIILAFWALWFGLQAKGRHEQAAKDAPMITDPGTRRTWKSLAQGAQASLLTCRDNSKGLEARIAEQNASVDALKADGDRRGLMLAQGLQVARKEAATANARAEAILTLQPIATDVCQRMLEVDRQINGGAP